MQWEKFNSSSIGLTIAEPAEPAPGLKSSSLFIGFVIIQPVFTEGLC